MTAADELNPVPERYDFPDLSDLSTHQTLQLLLRMLTDLVPVDGTLGRHLHIHLVRLVDKAKFEYLAAQEVLTAFGAQTRGYGSLVRGSDHLENCVTALHRACVFSRRLRRLHDVMELSKDQMVSPAVEQRLRDVRNAIEHADTDLLAGAIPEGEPTYLFPYRDHARVRGLVLQYSMLADSIRQLYSLIEHMNAVVGNYRATSEMNLSRACL